MEAGAVDSGQVKLTFGDILTLSYPNTLNNRMMAANIATLNVRLSQEFQQQTLVVVHSDKLQPILDNKVEQSMTEKESIFETIVKVLQLHLFCIHFKIPFH